MIVCAYCEYSMEPEEAVWDSIGRSWHYACARKSLAEVNKDVRKKGICPGCRDNLLAGTIGFKDWIHRTWHYDLTDGGKNCVAEALS
ncbi:MAG: hypothetical protein HQK60_07155 [Deltaproteobacteria bacterium]|nr:hypothetical protein [Deltaproteobacteria bacterium]